MNDEWQGDERRASPQHYEIREMIRSEFENREDRLVRRLNEMQTHQIELEKKLDRWESNAGVIKWTVVTILSTGATIAAVWEWTQRHLK